MAYLTFITRRNINKVIEILDFFKILFILTKQYAIISIY